MTNTRKKFQGALSTLGISKIAVKRTKNQITLSGKSNTFETHSLIINIHSSLLIFVKLNLKSKLNIMS